MKASPIQWALCATCVLLLLAKVWDWWQSLGQRAAPPWAPGGAPWDSEAAFPQSGSLQVGLPLSVVAPQIAAGPGAATAGTAAPAAASAPTAPEAPAPVSPAPSGPVSLAPSGPVSLAPSAPVTPASSAPAALAPPPLAPSPEPEPVRAPAATTSSTEPAPAGPSPAAAAAITPLPERIMPCAEDGEDSGSDDASGADDDETPTELTAHLTELAARELAAARLRAKSMLVNAEEQVRAILEEAERMTSQVAEQAAALPRPQGPDPSESRRQGVREGHAIGLRKGEIEALTRIEQVFGQIEGLLDAVPVSRTLPPRRHPW